MVGVLAGNVSLVGAGPGDPFLDAKGVGLLRVSALAREIYSREIGGWHTSSGPALLLHPDFRNDKHVRVDGGEDGVKGSGALAKASTPTWTAWRRAVSSSP